MSTSAPVPAGPAPSGAPQPGAASSGPSLLHRDDKYREVQQQLADRVALPPTATLRPGEGGLASLPERGRKIVTMHGVIQSAIGQIQDKTQQILQDQERDLIRAFRARLAQVQEELDRERRKSETGAAEWVVRCHKLTEEVEWLRDLTDKLTSENKVFLKDNQRYLRQLQTREEDRAFLIKQLVAAKKEIAKLRLVLEREGVVAPELSKTLALPIPTLTDDFTSTGIANNTNSANGGFARTGGSRLPSRAATARVGSSQGSFSAAPVPALTFGPHRSANANGGSASQSNNSAGEAAAATTIAQLKRDLDASTAALAHSQRQARALETQLRASQTARVADRSDRGQLLEFLKQAVEDVRVDIAERRAAQARAAARKSRAPSLTNSQNSHHNSNMTAGGGGANGAPVDPRTIPLEAFTVQDRINTVEWFLSQDKVIYTLYDVMFPSITRRTLAQATTGNANAIANGGNVNSALAGAGTARLGVGAGGSGSRAGAGAGSGVSRQAYYGTAGAGVSADANKQQGQQLQQQQQQQQLYGGGAGDDEGEMVVNEGDLHGMDLFGQV